jgi:hypothetical protein
MKRATPVLHESIKLSFRDWIGLSQYLQRDQQRIYEAIYCNWFMLLKRATLFLRLMKAHVIKMYERMEV